MSAALATAPPGAPETEIYNSAQDDGAGGLPKVGSSLASGTSSVASDHYHKPSLDVTRGTATSLAQLTNGLAGRFYLCYQRVESLNGIRGSKSRCPKNQMTWK